MISKGGLIETKINGVIINFNTIEEFNNYENEQIVTQPFIDYID